MLIMDILVNITKSHQCRDYLYLYYNSTKAYYFKMYRDHFKKFNTKFLEAPVILEHEVGFEKWSRAYFPGNRYDMIIQNSVEFLHPTLMDERKYPMTSIFNLITKRPGEKLRENAYVLKSKKNKFIPSVKNI